MLIRQFFLEGIDFLKQMFTNRSLIFELTKRDFKTKYTENFFGLTWAILEPLAMMLIMWLVFTKFFSTGKVLEYPFYLYMFTGLVAFDFFNNALNQGTRSIRDFSFLVKQVNFRIAILPMIYILSELIIQLLVLLIVVGFCLFNKIYPTIYWLQIIYFIFAACFLLTGITWLTSSVLLFFPDIYYIISIVMRALFFMSPIFWVPSAIPNKFMLFVKLNPIFYLVEGYRMCFLYNKPFWSDPNGTLYFWVISGMVFLLGIFTFKKLRPHFADVI